MSETNSSKRFRIHRMKIDLASTNVVVYTQLSDDNYAVLFSKVRNHVFTQIVHTTKFTCAELFTKKVAHTRLPSVGFQS